MGKAALLAIAAFIVASSYYNMLTHDGEARALRATSKHQLTVLARNAAIAGYDQAKQMIADADDFRPFLAGGISFEGDYDDASYSTTITSDGTVATIESVGEISSGIDDVMFVVNAVIGRKSTAPTDVPAFLTYALLTENSLLLDGNINGLVDDPDSEYNANFHTNTNLHVNGNAASVAGFGSYVGSGTSNPSSALSATFQPNHNPDGLESVSQTSSVAIPTFDAADFLENVDVDETSAGNVLLSGSLDLGGTREDPYIWHVQGDLSAAGGATVEGYVMFVVNGDIDISGNLVAGESSEESTIALYAGDDVSVSGSVQVYGQIYAEGDVVFSGTPDIYGSVASHSRAVLNGTPAIHYRPASPALATIFDGESQLVLLSYYEL